MYTPTPKAPALEAALEAATGRTTAITSARCVDAPIGCGQPVTGFRDALSEKEYRISGLCQGCQDSVFWTDEE